MDIDFIINIALFDYDIAFYIGSKDKAIAYVNSKHAYKKNNISLRTVDDIDDTCTDGLCFTHKNYMPVIWLPHIPVTPKEFSIVSHEIFHAVCEMTKWVGIELHDSSEEVYTYSIGYITREFLNKIKKYKTITKNG